MNSTLIFLLQIAIALLAGSLAARYLKNALTGILLDLCGTAGRADFWWRSSAILLLGLPLLLVLFLAGPGHNLTLALRHACTLSLVGILLAVGLLSWRIWNSIPISAEAPCRSENSGETTSCAS